MTPEEISFYQALASEARQVLTVIVPATLTGLFAYLAGRRITRLELTKLKAEHEFTARSKYYDFLKEQDQRVREAYESVSSSMDKIVASYLGLMGQMAGISLSAGEDQEISRAAERLLAPALETHRFILRGFVKSLERERENLLAYYGKHHPSETKRIDELQNIQFPSEEELSDVSFEGVRANTFKLKDVALMMGSAGSWLLHQEMESQIQIFLNKK